MSWWDEAKEGRIDDIDLESYVLYTYIYVYIYMYIIIYICDYSIILYLADHRVFGASLLLILFRLIES